MKVSLKRRIHYTVLISMDAAGLTSSSFYTTVYFHPWRLAADIPVAAGFITYVFSFEPEYIYFSHSVYINDRLTL